MNPPVGNESVAGIARPAPIALIGVGVAALALYVFAVLRAPLLSDDGVLYLLMAQRISSHGLAAGFELFDRPFYSAMIAGLHGVTGLGFLHAARLLNAVCVVLLALGFVQLCQSLHRDSRLVPWAALLLLSHPKLINYFAYLARDLGYWALVIWSFCFVLWHLESGRRVLLLAWAGCVLGAAAFRPEAIVFGLLQPIGILLGRSAPVRERLVCAALAWCAILVPVLIGILLARERLPVAATMIMPMAPAEFVRTIVAGFAAVSDRYASAVLDPQSRHVAPLSLMGGLLAILAAKFVNALGMARAPLLVLALWSRLGKLRSEVRMAYLAMLLPALLLPAAFVLYRRFLDTRYVMLLVFLSLAVMVPWLRVVFVGEQASRRTWRSLVLGALVIAVIVLDLRARLDRPKPYLLDCAAWLRENTGAHTRLFTNDVQLGFASGAQWDWDETRDAEQLLAQGRAPRDGVAWAIHLRRDRTPVPDPVAAWGADPVRVFANERGDRILVFVPDQPRLK